MGVMWTEIPDESVVGPIGLLALMEVEVNGVEVGRIDLSLKWQLTARERNGFKVSRQQDNWLTEVMAKSDWLK